MTVFERSIERFARLTARLEDPFTDPTFELRAAALTIEEFTALRSDWMARLATEPALCARFQQSFATERALPFAAREPLVEPSKSAEERAVASTTAHRGPLQAPMHDDLDGMTLEARIGDGGRPVLPFAPSTAAAAQAVRSSGPVAPPPLDAHDPLDRTVEVTHLVLPVMPFSPTRKKEP